MNTVESGAIKSMFDSVAPRYDFLNRLLSLRRDVYWRRVMAEEVRGPGFARVLDVACGTCDVALEISRMKDDGIFVAGLDFAMNMLYLAKKKMYARCCETIALAAGDGYELPFRNDTFDAVTIAFGIRNMADRLSVLQGFSRVLKPGGKAVILELTTPDRGLLNSLYLLYFKRILPLLGGVVSKNGFAYKYLPDSVINFPSPKEFADIMAGAGFENIRRKRLTMGTATLFVGYKP